MSAAIPPMGVPTIGGTSFATISNLNMAGYFVKGNYTLVMMSSDISNIRRNVDKKCWFTNIYQVHKTTTRGAMTMELTIEVHGTQFECAQRALVTFDEFVSCQKD